MILKNAVNSEFLNFGSNSFGLFIELNPNIDNIIFKKANNPNIFESFNFEYYKYSSHPESILLLTEKIVTMLSSIQLFSFGDNGFKMLHFF
jgi:hypothetical protein